MKRIKQTRPALECPDYIHVLPKKLADTLHQKTGERYTKFEAFRYLMQRQAVEDPDKSENHDGSFEVTITELSVDWGWHRHTVTAFLQKLVRLGYLTVEKTSSSFRLRLSELFVKDRRNA
jgi:DNA-binding MarR family transcriptional regulator